MNNRILTVADLLTLCKQTKMYSFNSTEANQRIVVQAVQDFSKVEFEEIDNKLFAYVRVCHTLLNRNGSYCSEESMTEAMPSLAYAPFLGYIHQLDNGEWDFESHNGHVEKDENGNETWIYDEKQIGTFTVDEPYFQYDEELDKTFVVAKVAIPVTYTMAADIIKRKGGTTVSCELAIDEMKYNAKENYLELIKFSFLGVCALGKTKEGKEIGPGMLGSRLSLQDFSMENNSIVNNFSQQQKLIETLEKLNTTLSNFNIDTNINNNNNSNNDEQFEEGGNKPMDKFKELLEQYGKTEDDITFETDGLSDEELEAAFKEAFGETSNEDNENPSNDTSESFDEGDDSDDSADESDSESNENSTEDEGQEPDLASEPAAQANDDDEAIETEACGGDSKKKKKKYSINVNDRNFELSLDDKIYALNDLVNATYADADNTWYGCTVYDSGYLVMHDYWNGRHYKQTYSEEDGVFGLTGDRIEVYATYATQEELNALDEMRSNYAAISEQLKKYQNAEELEDKMTVFEDKNYKNYLETPEFQELMKEETVMKYSKEELIEKCDLAFAKLVKVNGTFSAIDDEEVDNVKNKKRNTVKVFSDFENASDEEKSEYGDYFKAINKAVKK